MNQYIITEEQLKAIEKWDSRHLGKEYRSHPYNPQAEREKVLDKLHDWFMNYCEGNEEADLEMAFVKAEFLLRKELRREGKDDCTPRLKQKIFLQKLEGKVEK